MPFSLPSCALGRISNSLALWCTARKFVTRCNKFQINLKQIRGHRYLYIYISSPLKWVFKIPSVYGWSLGRFPLHLQSIPLRIWKQERWRQDRILEGRKSRNRPELKMRPAGNNGRCVWSQLGSQSSVSSWGKHPGTPGWLHETEANHVGSKGVEGRRRGYSREYHTPWESTRKVRAKKH